MATEAMGVGKPAAGACETELFLKRVEKAPEVTDPRRCCRAISFGLVLELPLSEDMVKKWMGKSAKAASLYHPMVSER
jgi:hypothetical protein